LKEKLGIAYLKLCKEFWKLTPGKEIPMEGIIPSLRQSAKERLLKNLRSCSDAKLKTRYLIVINLLHGRLADETASAVGVHRATVYRVAQRFRECGESGLVDRREDNGVRKLGERYLSLLHDVVKSSPEEHGWPRPTWTREMLVLTLRRKTGVRIHVATMSLALRMIGARRGRPKPTVMCPWSKQAKNRRLRAIQRLLEHLPSQEVAVYEDEVDIHLNPKIGLDWMVRGQQKEVLTPGKNDKRYLAGAQDSRTGEVIWVEGERKTSLLFIRLLWKLTQRYPRARRIHIILDNYSIHSTEQVRMSLATEDGRRLQLHFLPPYCPDHNIIERFWQDLHANVTRNHTCGDMQKLMRQVHRYLSKRKRECHAHNHQAA
jgi:transposase